MNLPSPAHALMVFLSLGAAACGAGLNSTAPDEPPELSREAAVSMARSDAAAHFAASSVASTAAHQAGSYWVVEMRTQNGLGLRYAISRQDGSIRQRDSFQ